MSKKATAREDTATLEAVQLLVNVRSDDTVYADLYLRRARELLAAALSQAQYNALCRHRYQRPARRRHRALRSHPASPSSGALALMHGATSECTAATQRRS